MKTYQGFGIYDFSDYAEEITGEDLIKINGGSSSCGGGGPGNGGSSAASGGSGSKGSGSSSIGASSGSCGGGGSPSVPSGSSGNSGSGFSTSGSGSGSAPSSSTGSCGGSISGGTSSGYNPGPTPTPQSNPDISDEIKSNPYAYAAYMAKQGQAKAEGDPERYKGYNVLGTKSNKTESPSAEVVKEKPLSPVFVKAMNTLYKLFIDDGKEDIFTLGVSASGTVTSVSGATGAGVYINPKSDFRFYQSLFMAMTSPSGTKIISAIPGVINNIDDIGGYISLEAGAGIGQSGSVSVSVGNVKSLEDAKGPYGCIGGSGGTLGISIGGDAIISKNGIVGSTFSFGLGVGGIAEGHGRIGYTGIKSFRGEM